MINLNAGKNDELLAKCKPLSDYMTFVNKVNYYKAQKNHTLGEAIDAAINYCIENDVLAEFLRKHRGDVMSTCLTEFQQEASEKDLLEEGRIAGLKEGHADLIKSAKRLFEKGFSYELVQDTIVGLTAEELQEIYENVSATQY